MTRQGNEAVWDLTEICKRHDYRMEMSFTIYRHNMPVCRVCTDRKELIMWGPYDKRERITDPGIQEIVQLFERLGYETNID